MVAVLSGCGQTARYELPYTADSEISSFRIMDFTNETQTAEPFAKDLCVSENNSATGGLTVANATGAALFDLNDRETLYAQNIYEQLSPASLTKVLTAIVALKNCSEDTMLTATSNVKITESGAQVCGLKEGDQLTLSQALHLLLINSANDAAVLIAEGVGGSVENFSEMMNQEALALGATNSHFVNPHGLYDDDHYTTAHDLALIAKAFFQNEQLAKIGNTGSYHFEATATQPDDFYIRNKHQLISGEISYEGIKGGKTGYTDEARQTLVTCAEQNDMRLICVILKEESPNQFYDTVKLFDYGFTNFSVVNVAENESKYTVQNSGFFHNSIDILGNSSQLFRLNTDSYLIMPRTVTFDELTSVVSYETANAKQLATINYYYHDAFVGSATIDLLPQSSGSAAPVKKTFFRFCPVEILEDTVIINVRYVLLWLVAFALLIILISFVHSVFVNYNLFDDMKRRRRDRRTRKKSKGGPHF